MSRLYLAKDITQHLADEGFGPETLGQQYDEVEVVKDEGSRLIVKLKGGRREFWVHPDELTDQYVWPINR